jgi:hypothetical protein
VFDVLHGQYRRGRHLELAKVVDGLELGLVRQKLLDLRENLEDVGLSRLRRGVLRVGRPFRVSDGLGSSCLRTFFGIGAVRSHRFRIGCSVEASSKLPTAKF